MRVRRGVVAKNLFAARAQTKREASPFASSAGDLPSLLSDYNNLMHEELGTVFFGARL